MEAIADTRRETVEERLAVFHVFPRVRRGRVGWCVRVSGLGRGPLVFCGPGLGPWLVDRFFMRRQYALGRYAWLERGLARLRGKHGRMAEYRLVKVDINSWPLPGHLLLALIGASTLRSRRRIEEIVECYARLDPLEPITPKLYELIETAMGEDERIPYKRLVRLSKCVRCWC